MYAKPQEGVGADEADQGLGPGRWDEYQLENRLSQIEFLELAVSRTLQRYQHCPKYPHYLTSDPRAQGISISMSATFRLKADTFWRPFYEYTAISNPLNIRLGDFSGISGNYYLWFIETS